jgi:hypothetical protein
MAAVYAGLGLERCQAYTYLEILKYIHKKPGSSVMKEKEDDDESRFRAAALLYVRSAAESARPRTSGSHSWSLCSYLLVFFLSILP